LPEPCHARAGTSTTSWQYARIERVAAEGSRSGAMSETPVISWRRASAAIKPSMRRCAPNVGGPGGNCDR